MSSPRPSRLARIAACAALALAGVGCASKPHGQAGSVPFMDSSNFDHSLSKQMGDKTSTIEVPFVARATANEIPERLDKWLYAAGEGSGGKVEMQPDPALPAERNPLALAGIGLAIQAYQFAREKMLYYPARSYDAIVYVDPKDGRITRVVFSLRPDEDAAPEAGGAQEKGVP
jgi:hypothetical protein